MERGELRQLTEAASERAKRTIEKYEEFQLLLLVLVPAVNVRISTTPPGRTKSQSSRTCELVGQ